MSERRGISSRIVIGVIIIVIVIGIGLYYVYNTPGILKPKEVTLSGTVTTTGTATTPEKITFTSMRDDSTYVTNCVGGGNPATYSITLPNIDSYKVTITWKAFGLITGGDADAGTLKLDETESTLTRNWAG